MTLHVIPVLDTGIYGPGVIKHQVFFFVKGFTKKIVFFKFYSKILVRDNKVYVTRIVNNC